MPHKPLEPAPDTIEPRAPLEAPWTQSPTEQPGRCAPEHVCPPGPIYTPDDAPKERPEPDPDS